MIRTAAALALSLLAGTGLALAQAPATGTAPSSSGAPATSTTMPSGGTTAARPRTATMPATTPAASAATSGQFTTEAAAKGHCPTDTVVWANTSSKAYHMSGDKYYGKTKKGAYMCQKEADAGGFHMGGKRAASSTAKPKS